MCARVCFSDWTRSRAVDTVRPPMADQSQTQPPDGVDRAISELHARANQLNTKLATGTGEELIKEARQIARQLTEHIRGKIEDYDDFVKRVELSEEFSLTESRQVAKTEQ